MRKAKLVLYQPQQVDRRQGREPSLDILPLEMLHVAALPAREGYEVVVIDASLLGPEEAHRRAVEACEGAAVFGTTAILGYMVADGHEAAAKVRAAHPGVRIIAGGWFPSTLPELYLASGTYDAVCLGQGELTFLDFVHAVECGADLERVDGLALWRDGGVVRTASRAIAGWDVLPGAAWHLLDIEPYRAGQLTPSARRASNHMPTPPRLGGERPYFGISYVSSFGCPKPCAFCCSPHVTAQRWKAMPATFMLDELAELHDRFGFEVVRFQDANWGVHEGRAREFCAGLLERGLRFEWSTTIEVESLLRYDPGTLDLCRDAGLYLACVGAESAERETIERAGKRIGPGDTLAVCGELHARGVITSLTYIIGFPHEPARSMFATLDQACEIISAYPSVSAQVFPFRPIPGNPMYDEALALGYEPPRSHAGWGEMLNYHHQDTWPGNLPAEVAARWKLYYQFAAFHQGLVRPQRGLLERMAGWRIRTGNFALPLELKAFHVLDRLRGRPRAACEPGDSWVMTPG